MVYHQKKSGNLIFYRAALSRLMCCRQYIFIACFFCYPLLTKAQLSNFKFKSISIENTKFVLDSLSIDPQSITVIHAGDTLHDWKYHLNNGELTIEASQLTDSLKIYYRVLPFSFTQKKFHRSLSVYDSNAFFNAIDVAFLREKQRRQS